MPLKRTIFTILIGLFLATILAGGIIYYLAGRTPLGYQPAELSPHQRELWAQNFFSHVARLGEGNLRDSSSSYSWSLSQAEANRYLASIDEIGYRAGQEEPISRQLAEAGLREPAIDFKPGTLTLMARSRNLDDRIVAVDLRLDLVEAQAGAAPALQVRLQQVRVGSMPIPQNQVHQQLQELKTATATLPEVSKTRSAEALAAQGIAAVLNAIDGQPVPLEFTWPEDRRLRITAVRIDDEQLTLQLQPVTD